MSRVRSLSSALLAWMLLGLAGLALTACETMGSKESMGTGLGGLFGVIAGSQVGSGSGRTAAIIAGGAAGAWFGNVIGRRMDENDRRRVAEALETSRAGQSTTWKNEATGLQHTVTPAEIVARDGQQCRKFVQEAVVDGQPRKISGTACKRPEGQTWEFT